MNTLLEIYDEKLGSASRVAFNHIVGSLRSQVREASASEGDPNVAQKIAALKNIASRFGFPIEGEDVKEFAQILGEVSFYEPPLQNTPPLAAGMNACLAWGVIRGGWKHPLIR